MNTNFHRAGLLFIFAIMSMLLSCANALAENTLQTNNTNKWWFNVGGLSYHFDRTKGYNEQNVGFGVEYCFHQDICAMTGQYKNSVRQQSRYASLNYQPLRLGSFKFGISAGVLDGYPMMKNGNAFLAAIPMSTWESKHIGVNIGVIPTTPRVDGAIIMQLKFAL